MRPMVVAAIAAVVGAAAATVIRAALSERPRLTQERVLAEAVSSYGDTGQVFLVGATVRPFTVIGYYPTRAAADSAATRAGASYRAYGPYRGLATRDPWQVLAITVRVRTDSGERELHYDPRTVDAVFLSVSAVRKFMLPYYRRLYGAAVADTVQAIILGVPLPRPPCHAFSMPCMSDSLLWLPRAPY
ncbi:MAG: hypothetical protein DMD40_08600 [Gemmatimonadetes bacterium]|nr:MAG: hypothetical protein DMD40_08600 [Gemmatimonadota bacterium]